ncbi:MAG: flavodoxin family protein [Pseudoramibacter sp.]
MRVLVITGSPRRHGTSELLADEFIRGAKDAGHTVRRFDAAFSNIYPCNSCNRCKLGDAECVYDDDVRALYPDIVEADVIALVSPIYYHDFTAQIKAVIDRWHGIDKKIKGHKKAYLLATAGLNHPWTMDGIAASFTTNLKYVQWENAGMILAQNCQDRVDIENSDYPRQAYEMGKNI